jgi:hypothetical protein
MLVNRYDPAPAQPARTLALMDRHIPDALVMGRVYVLPSLTLPDQVLAAAAVIGATTIISFNLKDLPNVKLARRRAGADGQSARQL